jgi:hypothetical protein
MSIQDYFCCKVFQTLHTMERFLASMRLKILLVLLAIIETFGTIRKLTKNISYLQMAWLNMTSQMSLLEVGVLTMMTYELPFLFVCDHAYLQTVACSVCFGTFTAHIFPNKYQVWSTIKSNILCRLRPEDDKNFFSHNGFIKQYFISTATGNILAIK